MSAKHVLKLTAEEHEELSRITRGSRGRRMITEWKVTREASCPKGQRAHTRAA